MATVNIIKGSYGLHTQSDQERSPYSLEPSPYAGAVGLVDFSACMNVDVSDRFRISRRRAITRKIKEASHSMCPVEDKYCLFVSGSDLNLLLPSLTEYENVATVANRVRVSCFVLDGVAYWSNGIRKGKIVDGENLPWVKGDVVSDNKTRVFFDPPVGQHLDYFNGRAYVASGKVVWYSEDYGPDVFSLGDSYLSFESDIRMVRHVAGGIYISDSFVTWFLSGSGPKDFKWKVIDDHPVLPYSDKSAVGTMTDGIYTSGGKVEVAFWLTNEGIVFGDANGQIQNISEEKFDLPSKSTQGAVLVDGSTLIAQFI